MTKQTKITAKTDAEIKQIALKDTYISEHNPRVVQDDDETIHELAKTIVASGLIHNLSGLIDEKGKVAIVAGGRRWRALQIAVLERPNLKTIPVKVTDDMETALSWAMLENAERQEMDKTDEIRAYGQSRKQGLTVSQIANAYCVTEAHVNRRLALSNLPAPVLDALKAGEINLSSAKAFTRSDDEEKILAVLEQAKEVSWWGEHEIIDELEGETVDADCREMKFVGLDAYKKAGGTIKTNLFNEDAIVENLDLLDRLFAEKLEDEANKLQAAEKPAWVKIISATYVSYGYAIENGYVQMNPIAGVLTDEQQARYEELNAIFGYKRSNEETSEFEVLRAILKGEYSDEQRDLIGAIIYVDSRGEVDFELGYVKEDDVNAAVEAGFIEKQVNSTKKADAPEFTQSFVGDMTAIRLAAVQTALLQKPELVLDLLGFGLAKNGRWGNDINTVSFNNERNKPEKDDKTFTLSSRIGGTLTEDEEAALDAKDDQQFDSEWERFAAYRAEGKKSRNAIITERFAQSLKTQAHDFMSMIEDEAGANIRNIWTPTAANCFKRMNAAQLNILFKDLLDLEDDSVNLKGFIKAKKGEKATMLENLFNDPDTQKTVGVTANQKAIIDNWVPNCFN